MSQKPSNSAERLKELMTLYNLRQTDLAKKTGIHKSTISCYVNGTREPAQDNIFMIANAFGVDPAWVMGYDVPMINKKNDDTKIYNKLMGIIKNIPELNDFIIKFAQLTSEQQKMIMQLTNDLINTK